MTANDLFQLGYHEVKESVKYFFVCKYLFLDFLHWLWLLFFLYLNFLALQYSNERNGSSVEALNLHNKPYLWILIFFFFGFLKIYCFFLRYIWWLESRLNCHLWVCEVINHLLIDLKNSVNFSYLLELVGLYSCLLYCLYEVAIQFDWLVVVFIQK